MCRIRQAITDKVPVIDVDSSYLYKKKALEESGYVSSTLEPPSAPVTGWEAVTESNAKQIAKKMPCVTAGTLYTYLSGHTG